jgi:hypothetical protein
MISLSKFKTSDILYSICLSGAKVSEEYITEYSTDKIEMHADAVKSGQRVLLVRASFHHSERAHC